MEDSENFDDAESSQEDIHEKPGDADPKNNELRNFIEMYETLPELWNNQSPSYMNKTKRNLALDKLLPIYRKLKPEATRADVRKKINILRSNYRKELKKIISSKRSGCGTEDVYQPTSWVFYALKFLHNFEQPVNSNVQLNETVNNEETQSNVNETEDTGQNLAQQTTGYASISSIVPSKPPVKKQKIMGTSGKQNELLSLACKYLGKTEDRDNCPTIAKVWGEKLMQLEPQQRVFAEKAINDIFFEASLGNLHRYSVKINEDNVQGGSYSGESFRSSSAEPPRSSSAQCYSSKSTDMMSPSTTQDSIEPNDYITLHDTPLVTLFQNFVG